MNVYATCSHLDLALKLATKLQKTYQETFTVRESIKGWGYEVTSDKLVCTLYN
jgi:hypothetical protein